MSPPHTIRVVAAVMPGDAPGELLLFRRSSGRHSGQWEFPGGKVDAGESDVDALARELREELTLEVEVGERLWAAVVRGEPRLDIRFYRCHIRAGEVALSVHDAGISVARRRVADLDLAPGDRGFAAWLRDGSGQGDHA